MTNATILPFYLATRDNLLNGQKNDLLPEVYQRLHDIMARHEDAIMRQIEKHWKEQWTGSACLTDSFVRNLLSSHLRDNNRDAQKFEIGADVASTLRFYSKEDPMLVTSLTDDIIKSVWANRATEIACGLVPEANHPKVREVLSNTDLFRVDRPITGKNAPANAALGAQLRIA